MLPRKGVENLIEISLRRLQKLKEQQALKGINSPPELLIEIEDLEANIEQLQAKLQQLEEHETAQQAKIHILASIPGVWSASSYEELADYKKLDEALAKVRQPDEVISASLSEFRHDNYQLRTSALASIAFIDLARAGSEILQDITLVRTSLPAIVFILYTTDREYQKLKDEIPVEWASRFEHYYKLRKGRELIFETEVRRILDIARTTAIQKREAINNL
jgi:hypothetical protein